jgi:glycosyltransferase involved in cell wall biosynthesis
MGLLPDIVQFCGAIDNMRRVYAEGDLLVLTSDHEGTPNVLMEAMASGLPVVATDVGGVRELIQHGGNGFVIERNDEEALTCALTTLVESSELRKSFGSRSRESALARFSTTGLPATLNALYGRAMSLQYAS